MSTHGLEPFLYFSSPSANRCGRRPGNKSSSAGFSRCFPEGVKVVKAEVPPFRRRHQARGAGATAWLDHGVWSLPNPGHMWLDLQPGDPAALIPQLCASGDYQCSGEPASTRTRCHCGSKRLWYPETAGQPTQQNARKARRLRLGCPHSLPPIKAS